MLDKIRCRITTDATTPRRRMSQRAKGPNPLKLQRLDQKQNGVAACRNSEQAKPSTKTDNQILDICRVKKSCEKTQMTTKKKSVRMIRNRETAIHKERRVTPVGVRTKIASRRLP